jgi:hypothetical protein
MLILHQPGLLLLLFLFAPTQFFPVEVYPVAAPVALAAGLFTYMLTRTIVSGEARHQLFLQSSLHSSQQQQGCGVVEHCFSSQGCRHDSTRGCKHDRVF